MRVAAFGCPVVPEVYWSSAVSSVAGRGTSSRIGSDLVSRVQVVVPFAPFVSAAREARTDGIGRTSPARMIGGSAVVTSTETMWSGRTSGSNSRRVGTTWSQAMTTFAPWSSNWCRSSRGVLERVVLDDDRTESEHA